MKMRNRVRLALLGLASAFAVVTLTANAQPSGTNQIALTDFDNVGSAGYGYFYSWGWDTGGGTQYTNGTYGNAIFSDPLIPAENGPLVLQYSFTNAAFSELMTTNAANSGYGTGFGSGVAWDYDWTKFSSTNVEDYILSFDARVEGLLPGQLTANCQMEFRLNSSLVDPPLPNNRVLQKNIAYNPSSNWTHFVFTLEDGGWAENTSYQTFSNGIVAGITGIEFNQNQHAPDAQFGFDEDNIIYIDNIKLEVITYAGPPPPPPPTQPLIIFDWNLDDKPGWGYYGGYNWSQNASLPLFTYSLTNAAGVGGGNGWILTMDNSALAAPNTPQWAGGGTGGGGPADLSRFGSGDVKAYQITFDSRAEGLNPLKDTPTSCALQLFLDSPNGNMRVDFSVPGGSNWVTKTYLLSEGSFGIGSKAMFATNYNTITALRTQWQIENANSETDWGYDADNSLIVDNIKLVYNATACPPLTVATSGENIVVTWTAPSTGTVKLQSATSVNGPYSEVVGATSPHSTPIAGAPKYFRTIWVPPTP